MSKKYTKKQMQSMISNVLCGAFEHMDAISKELKRLDIKDENGDPAKVARAKVLTLTLTVINDIIHPAHKLSYALFKGAEGFLDMCVENQKIAIRTKMVPVCKCEACPKEVDVPKDTESSRNGIDTSGNGNQDEQVSA